MPGTESWKRKRLWIGRLGLWPRGMLPEMKQRWHDLRPTQRAVPEHIWNLSWPESRVP